ncbi:MAG TPA: PAC2 family protein [Mycobacteriales bacterium]|jgi:predicted ATP-grasp superfamily ATP-dependent carboligase|nr:PAC2 family protein [Mycobacteriales bacterium]
MRRPDPRDLYELEPDRPELGNPVLVQALDGFMDAGSATRLARAHLMTTLGSTVVARFDADQLHDYRARRPAMVFVEDHWESYEDPELAVHLLHDEAGTPFLLLAGPEPDVQWERFIAAVRMVIGQLNVRMVVGLNAIPMSLPHTRPVGVITHGSRKELLEGAEPWIGTVTVPASAGHLLEHRLGQEGFDAMGFAAHVPHYVSQAEYPAAAAALVREIGAVTGLVLPTTALDDAAAQTRVAIDEQVAQSTDVQAVVTALEEQYDSFVAGRGRSLLAGDAQLPSADELGAELERYLAEQPHGDGPLG